MKTIKNKSMLNTLKSALNFSLTKAFQSTSDLMLSGRSFSLSASFGASTIFFTNLDFEALQRLAITLKT